MFNTSNWVSFMGLVFVAVGVTVAVVMLLKGFKGGVDKAGRMATVVLLAGITFAAVVSGAVLTFGENFNGEFLAP